ncbi:MAG: hypothetical protein ACRDJ3_08890 [Solirubrobacteraceae bacterium]
MRTLAINVQINDASSAGKLAGGIRAAIPITIAAHPSHFGNAAPRRIAKPALTEYMNVPSSTGRNSSVPMKFSVLAVSREVVQVVREAVFDADRGERAGRHQDRTGKDERAQPLDCRRASQVGAQRPGEQHQHQERKRPCLRLHHG